MTTGPLLTQTVTKWMSCDQAFFFSQVDSNSCARRTKRTGCLLQVNYKVCYRKRRNSFDSLTSEYGIREYSWLIWLQIHDLTDIWSLGYIVFPPLGSPIWSLRSLWQRFFASFWTRLLWASARVRVYKVQCFALRVYRAQVKVPSSWNTWGNDQLGVSAVHLLFSDIL